MNSKATEYVPPRRIDAIVRQLAEECLIIDTQTNQAHCLNQSAARVWQLCDGQTSVAHMLKALVADSGSQVDDIFVWTALRELRKAGLLPAETLLPKELALVSRRDVVRKIGVAAALALPLVTSILMPTPAQAATCFPNGHSCTRNSQCCSGNCHLTNLKCTA